MKLQTFVVGAFVLSQLLLGIILIWLDHAFAASVWQAALISALWCCGVAWLAHRLIRRNLAAPLQELVVLAQQVASHPDVPHLPGRIREIALLEDSLRRLASELTRSSGAPSAASLSPETAHELRSSLGAVKNALYYVKEVCRENHLSEKDPALLEIFSHAELEIEKAANIASAQQRSEKPPAKGDHRRATA